MLREWYMHPNGQIPAYEWNFSDVNPPVHAWATLCLYQMEQAPRGERRPRFPEAHLPQAAVQLHLVGEPQGPVRARMSSKAGFSGSTTSACSTGRPPLPTGGYLEQADGTAWMALFCQNMLEIAAELASSDPAYEDLVSEVRRAILVDRRTAMNQVGEHGMWDEEDGFYYDVLRLPDGSSTRLKVRSMVGLLPLCAATVIEPWQRDQDAGVHGELAGAHPGHAGAYSEHPPDGPEAPGVRRPRHPGPARLGSSPPRPRADAG